MYITEEGRKLRTEIKTSLHAPNIIKEGKSKKVIQMFIHKKKKEQQKLKEFREKVIQDVLMNHVPKNKL